MAYGVGRLRVSVTRQAVRKRRASRLLVNDDLDTAVLLATLRIVGAVGFSVGSDRIARPKTLRCEINFAQAVLVDEPALDRLRAALRAPLIVRGRTLAVVLAEDAHLTLGAAADELRDPRERLPRLRLNLRAVEVEQH